MKILVLSDSHSALSFMRLCIDRVKPDAVIHLGDYFGDGAAMAEEYPHIPFYQVPGNCDRSHEVFGSPETLVETVCGVRLYMTHGHRQGVKYSLGPLIRDAASANVQAVLFGHTHSAYCEREDNMWVVNPGSCGYFGGSAAIITVYGGRIAGCRIIRQPELEDMFWPL